MTKRFARLAIIVWSFLLAILVVAGAHEPPSEVDSPEILTSLFLFLFMLKACR